MSPGISLTQDFRENRFKAKYDADPEGLEGEFRQRDFSRSYKKGRTAREALSLVTDWLWTKHLLCTAEERPPEAQIDFLGAENLQTLLNPPLGQLVR